MPTAAAVAAAMPPPSPMPKPSFNRRFSSSSSLILRAAAESAVVVVNEVEVNVDVEDDDDDKVAVEVLSGTNGGGVYGGVAVMLIQQSHCMQIGMQVVVVVVEVALSKRETVSSLAVTIERSLRDEASCPNFFKLLTISS